MKYMTKTETNTETDKNQENNTENINEIENENENCPICYENFSGKNKDCVKNHNIESNCKHYFCTKCLTKMAFCNIIVTPVASALKLVHAIPDEGTHFSGRYLSGLRTPK